MSLDRAFWREGDDNGLLGGWKRAVGEVEDVGDGEDEAGRGEAAVDPYAYLKATIEAIASGHPASRIDELLPGTSHPLPADPGAPAPCPHPFIAATAFLSRWGPRTVYGRLWMLTALRP